MHIPKLEVMDNIIFKNLSTFLYLVNKIAKQAS